MVHEAPLSQPTNALHKTPPSQTRNTPHETFHPQNRNPDRSNIIPLDDLATAASPAQYTTRSGRVVKPVKTLDI